MSLCRPCEYDLNYLGYKKQANCATEILAHGFHVSVLKFDRSNAHKPRGLRQITVNCFFTRPRARFQYFTAAPDCLVIAKPRSSFFVLARSQSMTQTRLATNSMK